jgi:plastocyanin
MSKKQSSKRPADQRETADETVEQRRARQLKEWEARKKQKERRKSSGSPLLWVASGAGVLVLAVIGALILLQGGGGGSDGSAAATPRPDPRVAGLPVAQQVQIIADDQGQANNPTFDTTAVFGQASEVIEFTLVNEGSVAHNLSVSGSDKEFGTLDDFTMNSLQAGEQGTLLVKINDPGTYPFRCDLHPFQQVGTLDLS